MGNGNSGLEGEARIAMRRGRDFGLFANSGRMATGQEKRGSVDLLINERLPADAKPAGAARALGKKPPARKGPIFY